MIDENNEQNGELIARLAVEAAVDRRPLKRAASDRLFVVPENMGLEVIHGAPPQYINRRVKMYRPADFVIYVDQWATVNPGHLPPELFLNPDTRTFTAILDPSYNRMAVKALEADGLLVADVEDPVGQEAHLCELTMQIDRKLDQWRMFCSSARKQEEVALFLEERFKDVVSIVDDGGRQTITGLELKSVAREFRMVRKLSLGSVVDMTNGTFDLEFSKKDAPGEKSTVTFPEYIYLGLPVFRGGAAYQVKIRARYRLTEDDGLKFLFDILDWDELLESALEDTTLEISEGLATQATDSGVAYPPILQLAAAIKPSLVGEDA